MDGGRAHPTLVIREGLDRKVMSPYAYNGVMPRYLIRARHPRRRPVHVRFHARGHRAQPTKYVGAAVIDRHGGACTSPLFAALPPTNKPVSLSSCHRSG